VAALAGEDRDTFRNNPDLRALAAPEAAPAEEPSADSTATQPADVQAARADTDAAPVAAEAADAVSALPAETPSEPAAAGGAESAMSFWGGSAGKQLRADAAAALVAARGAPAHAQLATARAPRYVAPIAAAAAPRVPAPAPADDGRAAEWAYIEAAATAAAAARLRIPDANDSAALRRMAARSGRTASASASASAAPAAAAPAAAAFEPAGRGADGGDGADLGRRLEGLLREHPAPVDLPPSAAAGAGEDDGVDFVVPASRTGGRQ
jgi:hypothetical protein